MVTLVAAVNCALPRNIYTPQRYYAPGPDAQAQILRSDIEVNPDSFQYAYQTSNGIAAEEVGQSKQIGQEAPIVTQGQFSYTSPEGEPISLSYIADENGFQPQVSSNCLISI